VGVSKSNTFLAIGGGVFIGLWMGLEFYFSAATMKSTIRSAFLISLIGTSGVYGIYRWGFSGRIPRTMKAIVVNFLFKASILMITPFILGYFVRINILLYEFLLFFMLFSLSFLAIYIARIHENPSKSKGG